MTSQSSVFVRIAAHNTPHHTDPADAVEFYAALGMLTVAWGRLEGHVIGNLLTIMSLLGTTPQKPLPFRWAERLDLWKKGFSLLPALKPHSGRAVLFMKSIIEAANDRNYAAHTAWDQFIPWLAELTIDARSIKSKKGLPNAVEVIDLRVTYRWSKGRLPSVIGLTARWLNSLGS
jgi:hypothetical protein